MDARMGEHSRFRPSPWDSRFQLGALQRRSDQIRDMAGAFGGILANLTEEGIVRYIDSTITHGEFSTLQNLISRP